MYGDGRNLRYLLGFGLVIVLLFVVIFMIMRGGNDKSKVPETKRELISYVNDTNVTISETIIGPINAAQNHDEIQIRVTNQSATVDFSKGYDGNVVNSRNYPVTTAGFSEFLSSLEKAGYTLGNNDEKLKDDKGYCSTGQRYIFEVQEGSQTIQRYWITSCGGTKTYKGKLGLTNELFKAQIPDYDDIMEDASFSSNLNSL